MKRQQPRYWRTLAERDGDPELAAFMQREFPDLHFEECGGVERRRFLQLMGASLALGAGVQGCRWEKEIIAPYARRPEGAEPGSLTRFRTGFELGGAMQSIEVTCFDNRPYKIEPNQDHPNETTGTDAYAQASILGLFDPDRSVRYQNRGTEASAEAFESFARKHFADLRARRGAGLRVLSGALSSPTRAALKRRFESMFPEALWLEFESLSQSAAQEGAKLAFGRPVRTHYNLAKARIVLALDADLFGSHPDRLRLMRDWGAARDPEAGVTTRLYVVESRHSNTGMASDHRLALRSEQIKPFLLALEEAVRNRMGKGPPPTIKGFLGETPVRKLVAALADDLTRHRRQSLIAAGFSQPAEVHALAHRLNALLGNESRTVVYSEDPNPEGASGPTELRQLVNHMKGGAVRTLVILESNPVFDFPSDLAFSDALKKVPTSIHLGLYCDETGSQTTWHVPAKHYLESWGDGRTWDGTVTVAQPVIEPLYHGRSSLELGALMIGEHEQTERALVESTVMGIAAWLGQTDGARRGPAKAGIVTSTAALPDRELETARQARKAFVERLPWRRIVQQGFVPDSRFRPAAVSVGHFDVSAPPDRAYRPGPQLQNGELELTFFEDGKVHDGRFANNSWLQELPEFMTKLTWDNALLVSPDTARAYRVADSDVVKVSVGEVSIEAPVYVLPGQATGSLAIAVGYGRRNAGVVAGYDLDGITSVGVDVAPLRRSDALFARTGVTVQKTGRTYPLASTQSHNLIDQAGHHERLHRSAHLVREASLTEYTENPRFAKELDHHPPLLSLFRHRDWKKGHQWGMTVDLSKCVGCNACIVACTSENNVPVVGKNEILRGREMHWLRIDRYFEGENVETARSVAQPMACAHCENAPCEQVCPVAATVHNEEGLNEMAYNRCIGTRSCSNNCPYKVRRFNFYNYHEDLKDPANHTYTMVFNPEVSIRSRGVMEKCSYCTQRIHYAKRVATVEGRALRDGDIVTACQSACPTEAIVFGDINDPRSRVSRLRAGPRAYSLLAELNIRPRTQYLARINHPNPALAEG